MEAGHQDARLTDCQPESVWSIQKGDKCEPEKGPDGTTRERAYNNSDVMRAHPQITRLDGFFRLPEHGLRDLHRGVAILHD